MRDEKKLQGKGTPRDKMIKDLIESKFSTPVVEGEDKSCSLQEAIRYHLKKGHTINISNSVCGLVYQLLREFWDKAPEFTIISPGIGLHFAAMARNRIAKKAITGFVGINHPSTRPNPIMQNAIAAGDIEIENWTMRTLPQRLLAGAMGWDCIPTQSIIGSSMADDNKHAFTVIDSPFSPGQKTGLLAALRPDINLIHAAAADRSGNAILTYPLGSDAYGAWAATKGTIVSTEKIVSTETIQKHSHLVRVPSYMVLAVCEVPFGAHPLGVPPFGLPGFDAYYPDYDFMTALNNASLNEDDFNRWIEQWVLDCRDHNHYLNKVGHQRLFYLRGLSSSDSFLRETEAEIASVDFTKEANELESMVAAGGRIIADRCIKRGYKTVLAGVGLSNLAAWLAAHRLNDKGQAIELIAELGMVGYLPKPPDPSVFSFHNMPSCKMLSNVDTTLGVIVGGSGNLCLGILGAAQIDLFGNVNSTKITDKLYLVGSGGANDIASSCLETIVVMSADRNRLIPKVPYITYPGKTVRTLITQVGIFEKTDECDAFVLTAYLPNRPDESEAQCVTRAREKVSWQLEVAPVLNRLLPPSREELTLLRLFDPRGYYIGS